jgi:uncharacterized protein
VTEKFKTIYDEIEAFFKEKEIEDLDGEYVNGYLTAITCSPVYIKEGEWIDKLFFDNIEFSPEDWEDSEDRKYITEVLFDAYDEIEDRFIDQTYIPFIAPEVKEVTRDMLASWIGGFSHGSCLWEKELNEAGHNLKQLLGLIFMISDEYLSKNFSDEDKKELDDVVELVKKQGYRLYMGAAVIKVYEMNRLNIGSKYPEMQRIMKTVLKSHMTPEFIHGYIMAVLSAPELIKPSKWFQTLTEDHEFSSQDEALETYGHLLAFYTKLEDEYDNLWFNPYLTEESDDQKETVYNWAKGFVAGSELINPALKESKKYKRELLPIRYYSEKGIVSEDFFQGYEDCENEIKEETPLRIIKRSVTEMMVLSENIYRDPYPKTVVNENKTGRNDSCPCGSGKKYKKCCGK